MRRNAIPRIDETKDITPVGEFMKPILEGQPTVRYSRPY